MTKDSPKPYLKLVLLLTMVVGMATVNCLEIQPTNAHAQSKIIKETRTTITVLTYPSSWRDHKYSYRAYKVTWDKKVLKNYKFNPKNTIEGEFTNKHDDTDFSSLTGYEKHYHGLSISKYRLKIEKV